MMVNLFGIWDKNAVLSANRAQDREWKGTSHARVLDRSVMPRGERIRYNVPCDIEL